MARVLLWLMGSVAAATPAAAWCHVKGPRTIQPRAASDDTTATSGRARLARRRAVRRRPVTTVLPQASSSDDEEDRGSWEDVLPDMRRPPSQQAPPPPPPPPRRGPREAEFVIEQGSDEDRALARKYESNQRSLAALAVATALTVVSYFAVADGAGLAVFSPPGSSLRKAQPVRVDPEEVLRNTRNGGWVADKVDDAVAPIDMTPFMSPM